MAAFIGYGLAKGKGWQFYLIGVGVHVLYKYSSVLYRAEHISLVQAEVYIAVFAVILTTLLLLWYRRRSRMEEVNQVETG